MALEAKKEKAVITLEHNNKEEGRFSTSFVKPEAAAQSVKELADSYNAIRGNPNVTVFWTVQTALKEVD